MQLATRLVSTRRGTLIAALLIALLAGASILLYLNSYRDSLKAQGAMVTVLVAKKSIPKGTAGNVVLFVLVAVIIVPLAAWLNRKETEQ